MSDTFHPIAFQCCECELDVTRRVVEAFDDWLIQPDAYDAALGRSAAGRLAPSRPATVLVACANGHVCRYPDPTSIAPAAGRNDAVPNRPPGTRG